MAKTKKKMGRPRIEIDYKVVDNLCGILCTGEEIAGILEVDYDTLNRCLKRDGHGTFAEYSKKKSSKGKASLRRTQFKKAIEGNPTLLIWLGKQYLNQVDKQEIDQSISGPDGGPVEHDMTMTFIRPGDIDK